MSWNDPMLTAALIRSRQLLLEEFRSVPVTAPTERPWAVPPGVDATGFAWRALWPWRARSSRRLAPGA